MPRQLFRRGAPSARLCRPPPLQGGRRWAPAAVPEPQQISALNPARTRHYAVSRDLFGSDKVGEVSLTGFTLTARLKFAVAIAILIGAFPIDRGLREPGFSEKVAKLRNRP